MRFKIKEAAKIILSVMILAGAAFFSGTSVCGQEDIPADADAVYDEFYRASGAEDIKESASPDVQAVLDRYGITAESTDGAASFGIWEIIELFTGELYAGFTAPLRVFAELTAVTVFTAYARSLSGKMTYMVGIISGMAGAAAVMPDICSCFLRVRETVSQTTDFMTAFSPVFAGIMISGGNAGAGVCYSTAVYAAADIIIQITDRMLLPVLSMSLAISVTDSVTDEGSLRGLLSFLKTITTWTLGLLMTVFLGVLSVQGIVRGTADTFVSKTARYVVANFVPFVGGAVSDAYSTVLGSLKVLKGCTGFVGIVTLLVIFLPVFTELMLYRLAVSGAAAVSELFGVQGITRLLRGTETTLKMTFSVFVCFSVIFLAAIAVVLMVTAS